MPVAALAFSGGLDTSFAVLALIREGYDVVTVTVDTGGFTPEQLLAVGKRAKAVGARRHVAVDARREVYDRFFSGTSRRSASWIRSRTWTRLRRGSTAASKGSRPAGATSTRAPS